MQNGGRLLADTVFWRLSTSDKCSGGLASSVSSMLFALAKHMSILLKDWVYCSPAISAVLVSNELLWLLGILLPNMSSAFSRFSHFDLQMALIGNVFKELNPNSRKLGTILEI